MNREILFRGKMVDNGKWFEGDGIQYSKSIKRKGTCWVGGLKCINDWVQVIPETVGQYTGLTDKNGVKIFEGDIVKLDDDKHFIYEVRYGTSGYILIPKPGGGWGDSLGTYGMGIVSIIGNIHDNPEMMKGETI